VSTVSPDDSPATGEGRSLPEPGWRRDLNAVHGWLGFGLGPLEGEFRAASLPSDLTQARVAVVCCAMAIFLIGGADAVVAGPLALSSGRLMLLAGLGVVTLAVVGHLPRVARPAALDRLLLGWQLAIAFTALVYRATQRWSTRRPCP
jgi:hypothetical protein